MLDGHPSTQFDPDVVVTTDNGKAVRRPDGRGATFAADGIAVSGDGKTLYWQALTGTTLYKIPTAVLNDARKKSDDVERAVEKVGENGVSDGLIIDPKSNRMFISALAEDAIRVRDLNQDVDHKPGMFVQAKQLRWPDTFSIGPDGYLYVTASRIQDSMYFDKDGPVKLATSLWKVSLK